MYAIRAVLLCAFLASPALASVADGNFEAPLVSSARHGCGGSSCAGFRAGEHFGPWKVLGQSSAPYALEVISSSFTANGVQYNAASGNQAAFLSAAEANATNCISHYLPKANNLGAYHLAFDVGHVAGQPAATVHFIAEGQQLAIATNKRETEGSVNWQTFRATFGFTNDSPTIMFCTEYGSSGQVGLDNIRLWTDGD